jgi:hypothetical protein
MNRLEVNVVTAEDEGGVAFHGVRLVVDGTDLADLARQAEEPNAVRKVTRSWWEHMGCESHRASADRTCHRGHRTAMTRFHCWSASAAFLAAGR